MKGNIASFNSSFPLKFFPLPSTAIIIRAIILSIVFGNIYLFTYLFIYFFDGGCEVPVCWVRTDFFPVYHNYSSAIALIFSTMESWSCYGLPTSPKSQSWGLVVILNASTIQDAGSFLAELNCCVWCMASGLRSPRISKTPRSASNLSLSSPPPVLCPGGRNPLRSVKRPLATAYAGWDDAKTGRPLMFLQRM